MARTYCVYSLDSVSVTVLGIDYLILWTVDIYNILVAGVKNGG